MKFFLEIANETSMTEWNGVLFELRGDLRAKIRTIALYALHLRTQEIDDAFEKGDEISPFFIRISKDLRMMY